MAFRYWPRSLIARILLVELGAILIVATLLPAIMIWLLNQQMNHYEVKALREQAREIAGSIEPVRGDIVVHLQPDITQTYATRYDGRAYVIVDSAGKARDRSSFAHLVPWERAPRSDAAQSFRVGATIGVSQPTRKGGIALWVIVTQDETGRGAIVDDVAHAFVTRYGPVLALILLLLPLINSLLIRRLVGAVRSVSAQAETIGPRNLAVRLEEAMLPQEVAPLARAINALLVRLQQSFQQQSEFVANVAHELRTPLTTLKFQIEGVEEQDARAQLSITTDRLGHVISQLQALAGLESMAQSFTTFDLVELARDVIAELAPRILSNGDTIELEDPGVPVAVRANRTLIALALTNLVSNATQHTPPGTNIRVVATSQPMIDVVDDGPGVASSDPQHAKLRYWRADNRRSDSAGLGLSIVSRIMDVHDGELVVSSDEGVGARFRLIFPSVQRANDRGFER
jgi:two-component system OmpR family sensor kinase